MRTITTVDCVSERQAWGSLYEMIRRFIREIKFSKDVWLLMLWWETDCCHSRSDEVRWDEMSWYGYVYLSFAVSEMPDWSTVPQMQCNIVIVFLNYSVNGVEESSSILHVACADSPSTRCNSIFWLECLCLPRREDEWSGLSCQICRNYMVAVEGYGVSDRDCT